MHGAKKAMVKYLLLTGYDLLGIKMLLSIVLISSSIEFRSARRIA